MQLWQEMEREGMEELIFCHDADSGLRAVIAIHNTVLGPALGGCRYWTYASEEEAVRDAVKLAKGMTSDALELNDGDDLLNPSKM